MRLAPERFKLIIEAFHKALGDRDPLTVKVGDVLPGTFAAVPDTTIAEIDQAFHAEADRVLAQAEVDAANDNQ